MEHVKKVRLWLAKDCDNTPGVKTPLFLFDGKPIRHKEGREETFIASGSVVGTIGSKYFPQISWDNSPVEIEIKIIEKDESET